MRNWCRFLQIIVAFASFSLGSANAARGQNASFGGTILADPSEKPLANVEIVFTDLNRSVRSDKDGNFLFGGLPLGKHNVTVRLVGYEPLTTIITLVDAKPLEVDLLLKETTTTLKNIEIKAASPYAARLAEFESRREIGAGKFLTAEVFAKNDGRPVSGIMKEKIAGFRSVSVNGRTWIASLRGGGFGCKQGSPECARLGVLEGVPMGCYMRVAVNGVMRFTGIDGQGMFDIDELNAKDIIGFEFHTTATTPLQYSATANSKAGSCGLLLIWTK